MAKKPTYEELQQRIKALEKEIKKSKPAQQAPSEIEDIKQLLKLAPYGIFLVDLSGKIIACNDNGAEHLGSITEKIIGTFLRDYFPPDIAKHRHLKSFEAVETGKPVHFEDQAGDRHYYNTIYPILNDQGNVDKLAIYGADISDVKKTEEKMLESQERYKAIFDRSLDCLFVCDLEGNFFDANHAALNLLGYKREDISSLNFTSLLSKDQRPIAIEAIKEIIETGTQTGPLELKLAKKNGETIYVESMGSLIFRDGKPYAIQGIARDISDRKKSEDTLRESEEKYRTILNNIEEGYFEVDLAGNFTFFNESMRKILGHKKYELMGMNNRDYMDEENSRKVFNIFNTVYKTGQASKIYNYVLIAKDSSRHFIESSVTLIRGSDASPSGFRGIVRDVTDRRKAEEALRESEEKYRAILDNMLDGYIESDLSGTNIFINRSAHERLGYSREEYLGMNYKEYTTPENAKKLFNTYNRVYRTGEPSKLADYDLITKDGRSLAFEASVTLMKDISGKPIGFRALSRDITERKHSEEELKLSLQASDDIVKSIPSGLFIYRFKKPDKLFLVHGNPEAEKLTGLKIEDWAGKEFNEIWPEARKNGITKSFLSPMKTGNMYETENVYYKDQRIEGAFRIRAFKMPGSRLGVAFENITEKKRLEAQFHQAQKMEAIGTLAGGIAHDFNNLLMGILGRNSLMIADLDPSHPHYEHLTEIETYVKNAVDLTNQLLGFARGGKYEVVPTDINELIRQHNRMFGRTKKEINIKEKYEEKAWSVEIDRGQINQVLMNMYVNAWQAMSNGGDLFISTENMTIDQYYVKPFEVSHGKYVKISITDTGIGMNNNVKEKIFDPFFTTKEMQRGTGMGLSSAYGIIKNHRGFINVYSEPGQGTTFNIYLPASKKKVKEDKKIVKKIVKGTGTILLIDDEPMIVNVGEKFLQRLGYNVFTAIDGKQGINIYLKNKDTIDMVILDLIMPGMSGKDTFEALVKINPKIKVLLASGYSLNGKAKGVLDKGCSGFIQKPFNMEQLSVKIKDILKQ